MLNKPKMAIDGNSMKKNKFEYNRRSLNLISMRKLEKNDSKIEKTTNYVNLLTNSNSPKHIISGKIDP